MTGLQAALEPAPLKLQREVLGAGLGLRFASRWSFAIDAQRQEKKGTRPFGGAGIFMNNAALLPAPVDFSTDLVNMALNWTGSRAQLRLGFHGSWFDNGRQSLTWDNPFTATPQTSVFRSALAPDNDYQQFNVAGAWAITPRIHLSGQAATGEMSQNAAFLPYSINPEFDGLPLPRANLGGRVDTGIAALGGKLFARVNSRFSITARAKHDERDNRTPVEQYVPVISDALVIGPRHNRPYSFERTQYSADLRFRAHRSLRLSAGGRRHDLDRTLQAVEQSEETTWWGEVKWSPAGASQLRLRIEDSDRDVSDYQQPDDVWIPDHPLMRKYNQADRDRTRVQLDLNVAAFDGFGLNINIYNAEDEYRDSAIGLQSSEVNSFTIGMDWSPAGKFSLYGFVTLDEIDSSLLGAYINRSNTWTALTDDRITTAGLGFSTELNDAARLGLDLVSADTRGDILVQTGAMEDPFTPQRTDLTNVRLYFDYRVSEHWGYHLLAEYEDYSSKDWAIDGLGVDGMDAVLTFGTVSPDYSIWHLRAQATYRF